MTHQTDHASSFAANIYDMGTITDYIRFIVCSIHVTLSVDMLMSNIMQYLVSVGEGDMLTWITRMRRYYSQPIFFGEDCVVEDGWIRLWPFLDDLLFIHKRLHEDWLC